MPYAQSSLNYDFAGLNDYNEIIRIDGFLNEVGLRNYKLEAIEGDASKRKYYRILTLKESFILMDSSLAKENIEPFIKIASFLKNQNLSAPLILSSDLENSLLLLEDFGNNSFTKFLSNYPSQEEELYKLAVDTLITLYHANIDLELPKHNDSELNLELEHTFVQWYLRYKLSSSVYKKAVIELFTILSKLYNHLSSLRPVVVLKDYMADNLMFIKDRKGIQKVGLLDFQDAVIGSPAYDIASLLEDARREVSDYIANMSIKRFVSQIESISHQEFNNAYAVNSIQKNLRIIGVFHRLHLRDKKPKYLNFLPRMWKYVNRNLEYPQLSELKNWFRKYGIGE